LITVLPVLAAKVELGMLLLEVPYLYPVTYEGQGCSKLHFQCSWWG